MKVIDSGEAVLEHSKGGDDKRKTILTKDEFIGYLEYLRNVLNANE